LTGAPPDGGSEAPAPDRGLQLIVLWKLARGALLVVTAGVLGFAALTGVGIEPARRAAADLARTFTSQLLRDIAEWIAARSDVRGVGATGVLVVLDAALTLVQGIGLARRRWWAAWLTVVATACLIPFEALHLWARPRWSGALVLAGNAAIVLYLAARIRRRTHLWRT
jgi:uncharacterized membrane protein (DUF2068 family)